MVKHGYVERVGNAYRVTDKVNIAKLQRRMDLVAETAKRWRKWALHARRPRFYLRGPRRVAGLQIAAAICFYACGE